MQALSTHMLILHKVIKVLETRMQVNQVQILSKLLKIITMEKRVIKYLSQRILLIS